MWVTYYDGDGEVSQTEQHRFNDEELDGPLQLVAGGLESPFDMSSVYITGPPTGFEAISSERGPRRETGTRTPCRKIRAGSTKAPSRSSSPAVSGRACLCCTRLSALGGPLGHRGYHGVSSRVDQTLKKLLGCTSPWLHGDISSQVSCLAGLHVVSFSIDENMITEKVMKRLGKLGTAFVREPRGTRTGVGSLFRDRPAIQAIGVGVRSGRGCQHAEGLSGEPT